MTLGTKCDKAQPIVSTKETLSSCKKSKTFVLAPEGKAGATVRRVKAVGGGGKLPEMVIILNHTNTLYCLGMRLASLQAAGRRPELAVGRSGVDDLYWPRSSLPASVPDPLPSFCPLPS